MVVLLNMFGVGGVVVLLCYWLVVCGLCVVCCLLWCVIGWWLVVDCDDGGECGMYFNVWWIFGLMNCVFCLKWLFLWFCCLGIFWYMGFDLYVLIGVWVINGGVYWCLLGVCVFCVGWCCDCLGEVYCGLLDVCLCCVLYCVDWGCVCWNFVVVCCYCWYCCIVCCIVCDEGVVVCCVLCDVGWFFGDCWVLWFGGCDYYGCYVWFVNWWFGFCYVWFWWFVCCVFLLWCIVVCVGVVGIGVWYCVVCGVW